MGRKCQLTGKKANNAYAISHSHRRTKRLQEANLQSKRVWWPQGKRWVRLRLSTKAIKTLQNKGSNLWLKKLVSTSTSASGWSAITSETDTIPQCCLGGCL
jgi:large subunit ribosomal protein L28